MDFPNLCYKNGKCPLSFQTRRCPQPRAKGAREALCKAPSLHPQHLFVLVKHFCTNKSHLIIVLQKPHSEYLIALLLVISTRR